MMNRFSIIVPFFGDCDLFDDTLASVLRYVPASSQIIVTHDGTYDDPHALEGEIELIAAPSKTGLSGLFQQGLLASEGEFIALIRPGVELGANWSQHVESSFECPDVGSVSPLIIDSNAARRIVAAGVKRGTGFRRRIVGFNSKHSARTLRKMSPVGPTSWAAFYRRSALDQIGNCGDQMESNYLDLDLALSLNTLEYDAQLCPELIVNIACSSLIDFERTEPHGRSSQRAYRRHVAQSASNSPWILSMGSLMSEILMTPFQPWKFKQALGRLVAWRTAKADRAYADHLAEQRDASMNDSLQSLPFEENDGQQASAVPSESRRAA